MIEVVPVTAKMTGIVQICSGVAVCGLGALRLPDLFDGAVRAVDVFGPLELAVGLGSIVVGIVVLRRSEGGR